MMKSFFKKLAFLMALAMVVTLAAPAATKAVAADEKKLAIGYQNGAVITELNLLNIDDVEDLRFIYAPENWKEDYEWDAINEEIVTVDQSGVVTAVGEGTTVVYATVCGQTAMITVNVGADYVKPYTVTIGEGEVREVSEKTLKVGDSVDFNFYGVKDYSLDKIAGVLPRYTCSWNADNGSILSWDTNDGKFNAIGAGTATVTLKITNNITSISHVVKSVAVTVEGEEPVATPTPVATALTAKQTTENDLVLTFSSDVNVKDITKENIEIYEYYTDEAGNIVHEYIWQFNTLSADADKNTVTVVGYDSTELVDGESYVVRLVKEQGEDNLLVMAEDTFTASVGEVVDVVTSYASYKNNQYEWAFPDHAYTNCGSGEEIEVKVFYTLYDANGIDVTGHYERLYEDDSLITLELVTEDAEAYFTLDEETDILVFDDIPDEPVVQFKAVYEDYANNDAPVLDAVSMLVEEAPAYNITSIDDWAITLVDAAFNGMKDIYRNKDVALYDDYNLITGSPLENHQLVLWFTDNYGNKYVTDTRYAGWKLDYIAASEKFFGEGYEIHYESRNPQVLVVGDEYTDNDNSSTITTKKTGTATVNVTLYNTFEDKVVSRMGTLSIKVKAERYVKSVSANSVTLATDSIPVGAPDTNTDPNNDGDGGEYDPRFTTKEVDVYIEDQYGEAWGKYNVSARTALDTTVNVTNAETTELDIADGEWTPAWNYWDNWYRYRTQFDGVQVRKALNDITDNANNLTFKVTVDDFLNDNEKTTTFRVSLVNPTVVEDENATNYTDIVVKDRLTLSTSDLKFTDIKKDIKVFEYSKNSIEVNYKDNIELITDEVRYNEVVNKTATGSAVGNFYLVVLDPKGNVVDSASSGSLGIVEHESGLYTFYGADINSGASVTEFATAGNYTVKLFEVTEMNGTSIKTLVTMTSKFKLIDDRIEVTLKNQDEIYFDNDAVDDLTDNYGNSVINAIATGAFTYSYEENYRPMRDVASGVRFRVNERANSVVINEVFFKVYFHDTNGDNTRYNEGDAYYYVEIPVDKTVTLEDISVITDLSIPHRYDPEGNLLK